MIDTEGYRANVGIILVNTNGGLFWAKRIGEDAWQFPQGGIRESESAEQAVFRELHEEVGVTKDSVELIGSTQDWLRYQIPEHLIRRHQTPCCIGQKQRWFILRFTGEESDVCLDKSEKPEFDQWRWVDRLVPPRSVISFKRSVYAEALKELLPLIR
ncbi:MAG: RNA pyrophosphohydrolase [Gammaproteobacteria bacterium]|nr:RNA pyrophosphohydrolase [Gammaproteobacteria bacterium]MCW8988128.1 RNA pyrophosphohydrolase [Gammaproteobacteria bacterium]MCW9030519.1 RNA pyrophosphohydrolase [Gammaproteobacteria bacterium]